MIPTIRFKVSTEHKGRWRKAGWLLAALYLLHKPFLFCDALLYLKAGGWGLEPLQCAEINPSLSKGLQVFVLTRYVMKTCILVHFFISFPTPFLLPPSVSWFSCYMKKRYSLIYRCFENLAVMNHAAIDMNITFFYCFPFQATSFLSPLRSSTTDRNMELWKYQYY